MVDELEDSVVRVHGLLSLQAELSDPAFVQARRPTFNPRTPRRLGDPLRGALAQLRQAVEGMRLKAVPLETRVLEAIGTGSTWDAVAARLDCSPIDSEACAVRNYLIKDGRLARTPEGRFVPSTPPESSRDRSRRLRIEREAA